MKSIPTPFQTFLCIVCLLSSGPFAIADFKAYLPSRTTRQLWIVQATEKDDKLSLDVDEKIDLGFSPATIVAHPEAPLLYVSTNVGDEGNSPAAIVTLNSNGDYRSHEPFALEHGYAYLSLDRNKNFLLGADYGGGHIDVYPIDQHGKPGLRVSFLDEGRNAAHAVLPSPGNRFVYIPYVKDSNAILQYAFNSSTGTLTPLDPPNANPPKGTGPRHITYHPTLPFVYFSNEQGPRRLRL